MAENTETHLYKHVPIKTVFYFLYFLMLLHAKHVLLSGHHVYLVFIISLNIVNFFSSSQGCTTFFMNYENVT